MISLTLPYPVSVRFGLLTVIERAGSDRFGRTQWKCRCDCGQETVVALFRMKSGHTKSCGRHKPGNVKHGKSRTPTHNSWLAMKQRCDYQGHAEYQRYGGRGITVCERWKSFENFLEDMGERPSGTSIERIDVDGNYEPGNCRWAHEAEQARNRRSTIKVERDGVTMCVKDWCDKLGLNPNRIYGRIRRGEAPEKALR